MKKFINDESGATAIEYGLIAAAMGLMLVLVMPILATAVSGVFGKLATGLVQHGRKVILLGRKGGSDNIIRKWNHWARPDGSFLCNDLARLTLSLRRACDDCTARMIPIARQHLGNS